MHGLLHVVDSRGFLPRFVGVLSDNFIITISSLGAEITPSPSSLQATHLLLVQGTLFYPGLSAHAYFGASIPSGTRSKGEKAGHHQVCAGCSPPLRHRSHLRHHACSPAMLRNVHTKFGNLLRSRESNASGMCAGRLTAVPRRSNCGATGPRSKVMKLMLPSQRRQLLWMSVGQYLPDFVPNHPNQTLPPRPYPCQHPFTATATTHSR